MSWNSAYVSSICCVSTSPLTAATLNTSDTKGASRFSHWLDATETPTFHSTPTSCPIVNAFFTAAMPSGAAATRASSVATQHRATQAIAVGESSVWYWSASCSCGAPSGPILCCSPPRQTYRSALTMLCMSVSVTATPAPTSSSRNRCCSMAPPFSSNLNTSVTSASNTAAASASAAALSRPTARVKPTGHASMCLWRGFDIVRNPFFASPN
mmetsp:Transcript_14246/g.37401  ORF Transcript_14246/g.37401 Transcript_14246/m.37401 type:complete len:212 (+) Transcript_14246:267-902(+)